MTPRLMSLITPALGTDEAGPLTSTLRPSAPAAHEELSPSRFNTMIHQSRFRCPNYLCTKDEFIPNVTRNKASPAIILVWMRKMNVTAGDAETAEKNAENKGLLNKLAKRNLKSLMFPKQLA